MKFSVVMAPEKRKRPKKPTLTWIPESSSCGKPHCPNKGTCTDSLFRANREMDAAISKFNLDWEMHYHVCLEKWFEEWCLDTLDEDVLAHILRTQPTNTHTRQVSIDKELDCKYRLEAAQKYLKEHGHSLKRIVVSAHDFGEDEKRFSEFAPDVWVRMMNLKDMQYAVFIGEEDHIKGKVRCELSFTVDKRVDVEITIGDPSAIVCF